MALSELQKILVDALNLCGVQPREIVLAGVILKTEEQQWAMVDYLEPLLNNPPSSAVIMAKANEIAAAIRD